MVATAQELYKSKFGAHFLIVYHDLATLREMYSHYVKAALKDNQIVIILPFYETVNNVRHILSEDSACIDVRKSEKEQSLLIIDSLKGYFGLQDGLMPFVKKIVEFAKTSGKNGVTVLADMGSFFYNQKNDGCMHYEMTLPTQYEGMNLKGFCIYHKKEYERRFSEKEKRMLLEHHGKTLYLFTFLNINKK
jgi:choline kinase